jgi:hypothetical protein
VEHFRGDQRGLRHPIPALYPFYPIGQRK